MASRASRYTVDRPRKEPKWTPPPPPVEAQSEAILAELEHHRNLAQEVGGYICFRLEVNAALWEYWTANPPAFGSDTTVEQDEQLLAGRNMIHVNTTPQEEG